MTQYRLLRDNKETGPYSTEELLKKGLKAYDLVWVEGKSASWRYPSEIPDLRAFAPVPEEQPLNRMAMPANTGAPAVQQPAQPVQQPRATQPEPAGGKPRFRIKADLHKIELVSPATEPAPAFKTAAPPPAAKQQPVNKETAAYGSSDAVMGVGWEEALTEWKRENQPPAAAPANKRHSDEPVEATVKYTASLDDIKQRYEETILNPRKKMDGKQWVRYGLSFLLIPLLGLAMFYGKRWDDKQTADALRRPLTDEQKAAEKTAESAVLSGNDLKPAADAPAKDANAGDAKQKSESPAKPAVTAETKTAPAPVPVKKVSPENNTLPATTKTAQATPLPKAVTTAAAHPPAATTTQTVPPAKTTVAKTVPDNHAAATPLVVKNTAPAAGNKTPVVPAVVKQTAPPANTKVITPAAVKNTPANTTAPVAKPAATTAAVVTPPASAPVAAPPAEAKKRIADYVSVNDEYTVPGNTESMRLHVKNLSGIPVDLVVLDVQYYDAKGHFQKGETMYVNHLGAKDEVALQPPAAKTAQKVTYKVSLLSIEKKGVYLIAE